MLAIALAILTNGNFVFAAPGAVYVFGQPRERDNALISLAGPFTNLVISLIMLGLSYITVGTLSSLFFYISKVNAFIGAFNMLPIFPLDGSKVLSWNPLIFLLLTAALWFLVFYV